MLHKKELFHLVFKYFIINTCPIFLLGSCSIEDNLKVDESEPVAEIINGKYIEWNLSPKGESVRLCCGMDSTSRSPQYRWYELIDGAVHEQSSVNNYYDTQQFDKPGIINLIFK